MAEVFNLELHDGDNLIESDDDIIEVDEVSGFGFSFLYNIITILFNHCVIPL